MALDIIPALKGIPSKQVNGLQALIGGAVGLAGAAALRYGIKYYNIKATTAPAAKSFLAMDGFLHDYAPAVGGLLAGLIAYMIGKKKNSARAAAHLLGAVSMGVAANAWEKLTKYEMTVAGAKVRPFEELVSMRVPGNYGVLMQDGYQYADNPALADLAQAAMMADVPQAYMIPG